MSRLVYHQMRNAGKFGFHLAPDHILPFGMKDNFWEMGLVGPCGPCSEIHVNRADLETGVAKALVNQGSEDVVEIWNLVFMQYNRISNQILEKLPSHHIDTGMGLERLVAFLQNKKCNYETDLFLPLINAVHRISRGVPYQGCYDMVTVQGQRDWAYRLLADHSRMITVALADGAFPDNNHRLRRVMRQALVTGRKWFNQDASLLLELSQRVADMMGGVYPELTRNLSNVHMLLRFEEDVFRDHLSKSGREWSGIVNRFPELSALPVDQQPGLIAGLKKLEEWRSSSRSDEVPGSLAFKLYSTYGLQEDSMQLLAQLKGWNVDWPEFHRFMADERMNTKTQSTAAVNSSHFQCGSINVASTNWQCQDVYTRNSEGRYIFKPLDATVTALINHDGRLIDAAKAGDKIAVIADKSCFYYEAGGQVSDTGRLVWPSGSAQVEEVRHVGDHIYHLVEVNEGNLRINQVVQMVLDNRLDTMANHTATHLLQAALKAILKVTCQKSSHVTPEHFRFDFGLFQSEFTVEMISQAESTVRNWIRQCLAVDRLMLPLQQAVSLDRITLVPGESYPDMVSVIRIEESGKSEAISLEPCCGTHVRNTADLEDFAILSVKSSGIGSRSVRAVTRSVAKQSHHRAEDLQRELNLLEDAVNSNPVESSQLKELDKSLKQFRETINSDDLPVVVTKQLAVRLEKLESFIRQVAQETLARMMHRQVETAISDAGPASFVIVCLSIPPDMLEIGRAKLSLIKATRHCPSKPILVLAWDDGCLIGRCTVPQEMVTPHFDAEKWGNCVIAIIGGKGSSPKGQDPRFNYNIRSRKLTNDVKESVEHQVLPLASDYAKRSL
ncbi:alanine--tRNA ligase, mitochondrial-like isoform X2 [Daphnia carinata]|uniref:alanine--tRNA ligase, mitochondrial-like isoform X2 n=1 Tax=Daphnia carinata TaxID=120202 RepID=UPI0028692CD1|nr:alanine--tRNA ligase, mitochondrial-like isoform X2 [Daphnia carinata]